MIIIKGGGGYLPNLFAWLQEAPEITLCSLLTPNFQLLFVKVGLSVMGDVLIKRNQKLTDLVSRYTFKKYLEEKKCKSAGSQFYQKEGRGCDHDPRFNGFVVDLFPNFNQFCQIFNSYSFSSTLIWQPRIVPKDSSILSMVMEFS